MNNIINKIYLVLDASGSMGKISNTVKSVVNNQIKHWLNRSEELNQETRLSIYTFNNTVNRVCFDRDITRVKISNNFYNTSGNTALIDATIEVIKDSVKSNNNNEDESHLIIVISDGENNINNNRSSLLKKAIQGLSDNYTVSILVPNANALHEAKLFGFPAQNISVWDTSTNQGVEKMSGTLLAATDNYMASRSRGIRGTKSLFTVSTKNIDKKKIKNAHLEELSPKNYSVIPVYKDTPIKEYVESWLGDYVVGSAYFQLNKPEVVQSYKNIIITNKVNGKAYMGEKARELLSLPAFDVKVSPDTGGQYNIFVQSSSVNRKLIKGTQLIVLK